MVRFSFTVVALLVTAVAALAQAPGGKSGATTVTPVVPTPLIAVLLNYIGNASLTAELKINPEQVKKLTGYRQKAWDETYTARATERTQIARARHKATEAAFEEALTPTQIQRAKQIAARIVLTSARGATNNLTSISSRTLATYPELVEAAKLLDEQKNILTPQPSPTTGRVTYRVITFTSDQSAALEKFMGAAPAQPLAVISDPRLTRQGGPFWAVPADLALLRVKDIQNELKMTGDQVKLTSALVAKWNGAGQASGTHIDQSYQERDKQLEALKAETEKSLAGNLQPEQTTRLRQLAFQRTQINKTEAGFFLSADVVKALGLNELQLKLLDGVASEWEAGIVKVFETDQNFEATSKAAASVNSARVDKAIAILTPEQLTKKKDLVGAPYTGSFTSSPTGKGGFGAADRGSRGGPSGAGNDLTAYFQIISEASFGKYKFEVGQLARNPDVQAELTMTPEQIQKALAAEIEVNSTPLSFSLTSTTLESATKTYDARSAATEKAITDLLTVDQRKRFRQIMLQITDSSNTVRNPGMRPSSASYPGVAEAIKLTAEQKAKLIKGTQAADVLTDDQKTAIKNMLGEPYKGQTTTTGVAPKDRGVPKGGKTNIFGRGSELTFGKYMLDLTHIALNPDVQDELKLTPEQIQKAQIAYGDMSRSSAMQSDARAAATEKAVADILNADQKKRLRQIMLQIYGAPTSSSNLYMHYGPVAYPGVAEVIKLAPEQKTQILQGTSPASVLTDEQKSAIKEMLGEPYKGRTGTTRTNTTSRKGGGTPPGPAVVSGNSASPPRVRLLAGGTLDEPLKMTPAQKKAIAAACAGYQQTYAQALDDYRPGSNAMAKALSAIVEKFEKDLVVALSEEQRTRFEQLVVQSETVDSLAAVLRQPNVAKKLDISAEQIQKISAAVADDEKIVTLLRAQKLPAPKLNPLAARVRDRCDSHVLAVLTESQKQGWKAMTGEPWPGFRKTPRGPRGAGGNAGPSGAPGDGRPPIDS